MIPPTFWADRVRTSCFRTRSNQIAIGLQNDRTPGVGVTADPGVDDLPLVVDQIGCASLHGRNERVARVHGAGSVGPDDGSGEQSQVCRGVVGGRDEGGGVGHHLVELHGGRRLADLVRIVIGSSGRIDGDLARVVGGNHVVADNGAGGHGGDLRPVHAVARVAVVVLPVIVHGNDGRRAEGRGHGDVVHVHGIVGAVALELEPHQHAAGELAAAEGEVVELPTVFVGGFAGDGDPSAAAVDLERPAFRGRRAGALHVELDRRRSTAGVDAVGGRDRGVGEIGCRPW